MKRATHAAQVYGGLQTAFRRLVKEAGGIEAAAACTSVDAKRISAYQNPNMPDQARIDVVADLEAVVGVPLVTEQLARIAGCMLVPIPQVEGSEALALAEVLREAGEVGARTAIALGDGVISDDERAALAAELAQLGRAVAFAQGVIAGPALPFRATKAGGCPSHHQHHEFGINETVAEMHPNAPMGDEAGARAPGVSSRDCGRGGIPAAAGLFLRGGRK